MWSEGERMRARTRSPLPTHMYGIYSIAYTSLDNTSSQNTITENESSEVLLNRVSGISQRVNTMHLHEETKNILSSESASHYFYDTHQNDGSVDGSPTLNNAHLSNSKRNNRLDGAVTPPSSDSGDNDITETEDDSTASRNNKLTERRRRKSPSMTCTKRINYPTSRPTTSLLHNEGLTGKRATCNEHHSGRSIYYINYHS